MVQMPTVLLGSHGTGQMLQMRSFQGSFLGVASLLTVGRLAGGGVGRGGAPCKFWTSANDFPNCVELFCSLTCPGSCCEIM